ncbi:helix-turn-helix domain-containing protein [Anaerovibrio sp. RM50]|uniref:helix-turn-helix domain-containing protein n=1 Tax=Anaerovibrio sp. RM50 TaxID=1200557 RepID=UPI0006885C2F|nr:helix-turn-helix domain-containing protein [Anaerovibrio sp. RM50]
MSIGARLKSAREKCRLMQKDVSERTGIGYRNISHWENDRTQPSPSDLRTLADLYGVSTDWILGIDSKPSASQGIMGMLFKDDPKMRAVIKDIKFDGSINHMGKNYKPSEQDIAFIENAIRLVYEKALATEQEVVEIKPKEG